MAIALNDSSINLAAAQSFNLFGGSLLFNGSDITIKDGKLLFVSLAKAGEISLLDNIQGWVETIISARKVTAGCAQIRYFD
ncbi:MAG: hypothetical protein HC799_11860 [Limnothrix sp. RL_2_0]|nr:hypothetical protein [Limnothrix sp. RL_2_0]